jgi:phosphatidate cytidylyltransferase
VADPDPAGSSRFVRPHGGELALRICSALVLAPFAIVVAYAGGWLFAAFWAVGALLVLWEWTTLVAPFDRRPVLAIGAGAIILAMALGVAEHPLAAAGVLSMGTLAAAALAPAARRVWVAGGVPYAGSIGIAPVLLRADNWDGFLAIIFLFAVVWATDIVAYFAGRTIGGPKLSPAVSPNKTWSGAIGGTLGAIGAAIAVVGASVATSWVAVALLAIVLSAFVQSGDLFESFVKRKFGAKDSSHLIPGHGGLMDRLDGFASASAAATLIGLARGGFDAPGRGLLVW